MSDKREKVARVKPLEWELWWNQNKGHREYAKTPLGASYHVSAEGWWHPIDSLHKCDGLEAAKAAAQADYERRVLAALEPDSVASAADLANELHGAIMNLQVEPNHWTASPEHRVAYKAGHRDARHDAAELVLARLARAED